MEENTSTTQPTVAEAIKTTSPLPPKKTIALIVVLVLVTIGLVYLAVSTTPQTQTSTTTKPVINYMQTDFKLSSTPVLDDSTATTGTPVYSLGVDMTTGQNKVTAVQFELQYDPKALTNVNVVAGEKGKDWAELIKKVDTTNGIVSYALGINPGQKGVNGPGQIARITFSKTYSFTGQTRITFLPKTMATAEGYDKSVLKTSTGALFSFPSE
jgi:hypothetical protein